MLPYYLTHVQALVDEGIVERNKLYDANDKDLNGVPKQCVAFWIESQRWRALSFDEMRLDGATHGDGGDRKGHTGAIPRPGLCHADCPHLCH